MKKAKPSRQSIDGLIPRRPYSEIGERHIAHTKGKTPVVPRKELQTQDELFNEQSTLGSSTSNRELGQQSSMSELDESLRLLDDATPTPKLSRRERKRLKKANRTKAQRVRGRVIKIAIILIVAALLGVAGFMAYKVINTGGKVLQGSIFDIAQNEPLREDANGRSNFLVFGTEANGHPGANLTDSIMVVSVNQHKHDAYMVSLPRDLWVAYADPCTVGFQGKLNAAYFCASEDGTKEEAGAKALMAQAKTITGLDIHYYVHVNWEAVIEGVDAVGGVDVTIESSDPRGILDRNFDWICNFQCYYVNYKNGEKVHLDGQHALALARARNASGGYGLPNGNFDREKNQQLIIRALRDKAASAGTLTNIGAVTGLLDALGNNLKTNIQTKEVRTLIDIANKLPSEKIISLSLNDEDAMLVTTGSYNGQSIVRPIAGLMEYGDIHAYIQHELSSDPFVKESPHVTVLNGSDVAGAAQAFADELEEKGFTIDAIDNAPGGTYSPVEIYQVNSKKTATAAKLKELYGSSIKTTAPPVSVLGTTDFVIILGAER